MTRKLVTMKWIFFESKLALDAIKKFENDCSLHKREDLINTQDFSV
jgi:hypothetical protein